MHFNETGSDSTEADSILTRTMRTRWIRETIGISNSFKGVSPKSMAGRIQSSARFSRPGDSHVLSLKGTIQQIIPSSRKFKKKINVIKSTVDKVIMSSQLKLYDCCHSDITIISKELFCSE